MSADTTCTWPRCWLFVGTHDGVGAPESLHSPTFLPDDKTVGAVADAMLTGYVAAGAFTGG